MTASPPAPTEEEKRESKQTKIAIALFIASIAILFWFANSPYSEYGRMKTAQKTYRQVVAIMQQYKKILPRKMPYYLTDLPVEGTVKVTADSKTKDMYSYGEGLGAYYYIDYYAGYNVTLTTDASFDKKSDTEIYEALGRLSGRAAVAFNYLIKAEFPEFAALERGEYNGEWYRCLRSWEYTDDDRYSKRAIIETPAHTYEWAENVANYYVMDDKDHFVRGGTSSSGSSGSSSSGGTRGSGSGSSGSSSRTESNTEATTYKSDETRCRVILCNNKRTANSFFCSSHKCAVHECPKQRIKTDIYCQDHVNEFAGHRDPQYSSRPGGTGSGSGKSGSGSSRSDAEEWAEEYADEFGDFDEAYEYYLENE